MIAQKACSRCQEDKPGVAFYPRPASTDGLRSWCIDCCKRDRENRRDRNHQKFVAQERARGARHREANRERERARANAFRRKNPEAVAAQVQRRQERLSKAPGGPYDNARYIGRLAYYRGQCAYCWINKATTFDHAIPVSRGGGNWPSNIYPACRSCNASKGPKKLRSEWRPPAW